MPFGSPAKTDWPRTGAQHRKNCLRDVQIFFRENKNQETKIALHVDGVAWSHICSLSVQSPEMNSSIYKFAVTVLSDAPSLESKQRQHEMRNSNFLNNALTLADSL